MADLAADCLDSTAFDLLPFEMIVKDYKPWGKGQLADAYLLPEDKIGALAEDYHERLEDKIEDARENPFNKNYWDSPLLELGDVRVPADAFAKVRKRFRMMNLCLAK